jgi:hypothetical protein
MGCDDRRVGAWGRSPRLGGEGEERRLRWGRGKRNTRMSGERESSSLWGWGWVNCYSVYSTNFYSANFSLILRVREGMGSLLEKSNLRPLRMAYQPPASSTFHSEQTSHQQSANNICLSKQISINHQQPAKRTGCSTEMFWWAYVRRFRSKALTWTRVSCWLIPCNCMRKCYLVPWSHESFNPNRRSRFEPSQNQTHNTL